MISYVVAADKNFAIGKNNGLPWPRLPADMKHFRELTTGKTIIMGRKTFESIGSKPLPNRENVVLTRDAHFKADGVVVVKSTEEALKYCERAEEACIIGGATLYKEFLPYVDIIHFTQVEGEFEGDTFLSSEIFDGFKQTEQTIHEADEKNPYTLFFRTYKKQ